MSWLVPTLFALVVWLALWGEAHPDFLAGLRQSRWLRTDLVISILLWLAALLIWNSAS